MELDPMTPTKIPTRNDQYDEPLPERMKADTCYHCGELGHWKQDCPALKNLNKLQPSSTTSPVTADVQLLRCKCGSTCNVFTSRTDKNPNRQFYICSTRKCNLFKWCDKLKWDAPMCPCGAGKCSINTDRGDPFYFACRVKKGLGACPFTYSVNSYREDNLSISHTNAGTSDERMPDLIETIPDPAVIDQELDMEELMLDYVTKKLNQISNNGSPSDSEKALVMDENLSPDHKHVILEEDEFSPEEIDSLYDLTEGDSRISQAEISQRQRIFMNQIDAAADESAEDDTQLIPRSRNAAINEAPQESYAAILKKAAADIQQEFISRLDSINIDLHSLEVEATKCFSVLESIHLNHEQFKTHVMQYIRSLSTLSTIDADPTFQELVDLHSKKKRKFEALCAIHKEKTCKYKAYGDRIDELREVLRRTKEEMEKCEAEYRETELCLVEIDQKVKRAKRSVEMADREVDEVRRQREVERGAAKAALDEARGALLEH